MTSETSSRDGSDTPLTSSDSDMDFEEVEPTVPQLAVLAVPSNPASPKVKYEVPGPRSILDFTPMGPYWYAIALTSLLDLDLEKDHLRLLKSINRLLFLHEILHEDLIEDFDLTMGSIESIKDLRDNLCQSPDVFERFLGKEKHTYLIDACNFMYYSSLVKKDIEQLPDAKMKEAFEHLYDSICMEGEHGWHDIMEE